jgi:hypothetical protein
VVIMPELEFTGVGAELVGPPSVLPSELQLAAVRNTMASAQPTAADSRMIRFIHLRFHDSQFSQDASEYTRYLPLESRSRCILSTESGNLEYNNQT